MSKAESRVNKQLPCKLSDKEFKERATELAEVGIGIEELEALKKAAMKNFSEQIGGKVARERQLQTIVQDREELREVRCKWLRDYKAKEIQLQRLDTNEIVDTRTMTELELQTELDLGRKARQDKAAADKKATKKKASPKKS